MDVIALLSTSDEAIQDFLQQPYLPNNVPIHAFNVPRQKIPVTNAKGDIIWRSSWFRGRDPHSVAVGEAHKHVLRSMLKMYPTARSVLVFEDDARMRPGMLPVLQACSKWMKTHDDWDLFYLGQYPALPTTQVAPHVVETPFPLAAHAIVYHRRIIDIVLSWKFYFMGIDERIALLTPKWKKYAAYPDVFYQCREPILSKLVRPLWPNIIGLPFVRTHCHQAFTDDLNHLMFKSTTVWPMVLAVVVFFVIVVGLGVTWLTVSVRHLYCCIHHC